MFPLIVTAAVIIDGDRKLFLARRKKGDSQGGLWELPGGKVEPGEKPSECLEREIEEELAMKVAASRPFNFSYWDYSGKRVLLLAYFCEVVSGEPKNIGCADSGFFSAPAIRDGRVNLAPADVALVGELIERGLVK